MDARVHLRGVCDRTWWPLKSPTFPPDWTGCADTGVQEAQLLAVEEEAAGKLAGPRGVDGFGASWIICKASSMLGVPTWLPSSSREARCWAVPAGEPVVRLSSLEFSACAPGAQVARSAVRAHPVLLPIHWLEGQVLPGIPGCTVVAQASLSLLRSE